MARYGLLVLIGMKVIYQDVVLSLLVGQSQ